MLVLTRKYQEKVRIGDNITITVLRTKGKAVRLGIEAPADIAVIRGELSFEPVESAAPAAATGLEPTTDRTPARAVDAAASWPAESPQVSVQRVPRDQLAGVLPKLVPGGGPLRAVMDQR